MHHKDCETSPADSQIILCL